jgi:hypothetical protein
MSRGIMRRRCRLLGLLNSTRIDKNALEALRGGPSQKEAATCVAIDNPRPKGVETPPASHWGRRSLNSRQKIRWQ